MNKQKIKQAKKHSRVARVRATIFGTANRPRLAVFRSLKHIGVQLINDEAGKTLVSATDLELTKDTKKKKMDKAQALGTLIAEKAQKAGIQSVVFDRRSYKFHGRIKNVADGARAGGLKF